MAGFGTLASPYTPNGCVCGHDYQSHNNPSSPTGLCFQCQLVSGGNNHAFVSTTEINNPFNSNYGAAATRGPFDHSDYKDMVIAAETVSPTHGPTVTGPGRPPNGQRTG